MASMVLVAVTVLVGLVVGYARGGRLSNFDLVHLHRGWLLGLAVAAQLAIPLLAALGLVPAAAYPFLLVSHLALFGFIWFNRRLPGMALIFIGFALNALVIGANGAMPVSPSAIEQVAGQPTEEIDDVEGKHRLLEEDDHLAFLADVVPLAPLRTVVSVGDFVLAAGVCVLVVSLMRGRGPPRERPRPASPLGGEETDR